MSKCQSEHVENTLKDAIRTSDEQHQLYQQSISTSNLLNHSDDLKALAEQLNQKLEELNQKFREQHLTG
jgi:benzoyl-CoA reductase/2-hydroxyglutaryl-CoA dehydratase subunit BcrC/BadD/HgdB